MYEISTSQSTPFNFGIPIFRICETIFDFPQNTQLRLHQKSDAKTKHSSIPSITNSNNLFGPFKQQDTTSPPFLLPLDVMYNTSRREQIKVPIKPLLDPALDFCTVKYMQLTQIVPRNSELLFGQFN